MKPTEAAALLTIAAAYDNRKPDADQAKAWAMALDGLRFEDCREVIVAHYRKSRDWLMPSDVVGGVMRLRAKRIDDYGPIEAPPGIDPDDVAIYRRHIRTRQREIADGDAVKPESLTGRRRDVIAELGHIGREIPDDDAAAARQTIRDAIRDAKGSDEEAVL
jgi:hypothetical protein